MNPTDLSALIDLLRAKGVTSYRTDEIELHLGPLSGPGPAFGPHKSNEPVPAPDMCPCGHPLLHHSAGGCIGGCSVEQCEPHLSKE